MAREVIQDRAEIKPAPVDHLEIGDVDQPELTWRCRLVLELVNCLHDEVGGAGDPVMRLEQPINRSL